MKFDMHCHTAEGSMDARVTIEDYISLLKEQGFGGMLVTDHNSYKGYNHWNKELKGKVHTDFVVLKGIEYDTRDGGHILVIVPEDVNVRVLEMRGMRVRTLCRVVHAFGGILGPAHPCGEKYMSFQNSAAYRKNPAIMESFDFVEIYNPCEPPEANEKARQLAIEYEKTGFGGSDSHKPECIGLAYTTFCEEIHCETELISYVKRRVPTKCGGGIYAGTTKDKMGKAKSMFAYSFWVYNKAGALARTGKRHKHSKYLSIRKREG